MKEIIEFNLCLKIFDYDQLFGIKERIITNKVNAYIAYKYKLIEDFYEFTTNILSITDNCFDYAKIATVKVTGFLKEKYFNDCKETKERLEIGL